MHTSLELASVYGSVAERSMALVLKTSVPKGTVGSNPTASSKIVLDFYAQTKYKSISNKQKESNMNNPIVFAWNFIFNHEVSPLRHLPDIATRHYVLQTLGFLWAAAFSTLLGSYTFFAFSVVGHVALIGVLAITVATLATAQFRPSTFTGFGRSLGGEHE